MVKLTTGNFTTLNRETSNRYILSYQFDIFWFNLLILMQNIAFV